MDHWSTLMSVQDNLCILPTPCFVLTSTNRKGDKKQFYSEGIRLEFVKGGFNFGLFSDP